MKTEKEKRKTLLNLLRLEQDKLNKKYRKLRGYKFICIDIACDKCRDSYPVYRIKHNKCPKGHII